MNENNVKYLILIILCFIILGILFCIVTSKLREGLDNVGLRDFTNSDPNIRPTPLPDICIGNGNFISQPDSTIPVTATAGYLHSNIGACENECTPERGCFAVSFDNTSKDAIKKCNIYSGASSTGGDTVKAGTLCSRISPTCSVADYKLNNTSSELATVIKPNGGEYFTHSSEAACAVECNNREDCIGYLYDNKSKNFMKPCRIFSKNRPGASSGFPVAGICSRNLVSSSYFNGTWQNNICPNWGANLSNQKFVFKVDGNKIKMTPLDPNLLSISGIGNATIDGDGLSGSWARGDPADGNKFSGVLIGDKIFWSNRTKDCWSEKISSSTDIPTPPPPGTPPPGTPPTGPSGKCVPNVPALLVANNAALNNISAVQCPTKTREEDCGALPAFPQFGTPPCPLCCQWQPVQAPPPGASVPPPPPTGKCSVYIPGLIATYGVGYLPAVPIATANCAKETTAEGCIYMAQGGGGAKAPLCAWTPTPVPPPVAPPSQVSGLAGNWHQVGMPTTVTISLQDAGTINGQPKIIGVGPGLFWGNGWGFLNTPNSMFFKFGNGVTIPAALLDKNSSGQFNKIEFNNGAVWTRITSPGTPSPTTPGTPPPTTSVIPQDHRRAKIINRVLNPIIGRGAYQSPLPVAQ